MSLVAQKFTRKVFDVRAVRVTPDNMAEVAQWCRGALKNDPDFGYYIELVVTHYKRSQKARAVVGDWVVSAGSFKVYRHRAFTATFVPKPADLEEQV